ncbi:unnamed protein product [Urochloa humidicola]
MVRAFAAAFTDLFLAIAALELFSFLDPQIGVGTTASAQQAPLLDIAAEVWMPCTSAAAAGFLFVIGTVAFTYHHLSHAGAGNRRLSGLVMFMLCVSVGTLDYVLFAQAVGGAAQARALGLAALRALPAASVAAFFWGMMLVFVAHVRAGGEGGGGGNGDGHEPVQWRVRVLSKVAVGAAAALVCMMALAFYGAK